MTDFFENDNFEITVTSATGVEKVTKSELKRLFGKDLPANRGAISFCGTAEDVVSCNMRLRTADRVYVKTAEFSAPDFDSLYDGVRAVDWQRIFPKDALIKINGKCHKSKLFAISACQSVIKKAIADKLCSVYKMSSLPETGGEYSLEFRIESDVARILLDTSGTGLHKRGYRDLVGIAPIKETLAAALVLLSDFYFERPFADPFCGSGTIAIEAAMIALNIAPGINRRFAFDGWKGFDKKIRERVFEQAKASETLDRRLEFFASDIDKKAIKLAERHAARAGIGNRIKFKVSDVADFSCKLPRGTIVTNPPYGERVYDKESAKECYKSLKKAFDNLDNWSLFVITAADFFCKQFGLKPDRNRKLFNSNRECRYYYYYGKGESYVKKDD